MSNTRGQFNRRPRGRPAHIDQSRGMMQAQAASRTVDIKPEMSTHLMNMRFQRAAQQAYSMGQLSLNYHQQHQQQQLQQYQQQMQQYQHQQHVQQQHQQHQQQYQHQQHLQQQHQPQQSSQEAQHTQQPQQQQFQQQHQQQQLQQQQQIQMHVQQYFPQYHNMNQGQVFSHSQMMAQSYGLPAGLSYESQGFLPNSLNVSYQQHMVNAQYYQQSANPTTTWNQQTVWDPRYTSQTTHEQNAYSNSYNNSVANSNNQDTSSCHMRKSEQVAAYRAPVANSSLSCEHLPGNAEIAGFPMTYTQHISLNNPDAAVITQVNRTGQPAQSYMIQGQMALPQTQTSMYNQNNDDTTCDPNAINNRHMPKMEPSDNGYENQNVAAQEDHNQMSALAQYNSNFPPLQASLQPQETKPNADASRANQALKVRFVDDLSSMAAEHVTVITDEELREMCYWYYRYADEDRENIVIYLSNALQKPQAVVRDIFMKIEANEHCIAAYKSIIGKYPECTTKYIIRDTRIRQTYMKLNYTF